MDKSRLKPSNSTSKQQIQNHQKPQKFSHQNQNLKERSSSALQVQPPIHDALAANANRAQANASHNASHNDFRGPLNTSPMHYNNGNNSKNMTLNNTANRSVYNKNSG